MKTIILSLLFTCTMCNSFAQTETATYKTVADKFEQHYNYENFDSIFSMFDVVMQKALPLEKTIEFLTGLKAHAGKIKKKQFIKFANGTVAVYKTNFEQTLLALNISLDKSSKINGLFINQYVDDSQPKLLRNTTKLILPFKDEWTVFWGGDTKELNYHVSTPAQKNAFDIIITDAKGSSYKTDGKTNEDYYAFGKELIAPCDGEIVLVVDGVKDNVPGQMNSFNVGGNMVIIKTANNEYLVFCHFKHQSIKVKEGQKIKQGDLLGLCGNTGNSSEAHLHFHIQNIEDLNTATGAKCYFEKIFVNGQVKQDYSPVKNDKIKN
ncbi:MAG: peptidoglycan DD-metalloendopeptidase family protein [Ferruginibacter sp.]|nr:peptidoglycan DD-metalloendopeptidase family protein [Chitinophagaceae bacterium]